MLRVLAFHRLFATFEVKAMGKRPLPSYYHLCYTPPRGN